MSLRGRVSFGALSDTQVTPRTPYVLVRYVAPDGVPVWLEGQCPVGIVEARTHDSVLPALTQVELATAQGLTAVGFVAYEAAHGLDSAFPRADAPLPLVWFAVYEGVRAYPDPIRASSVNGRSHLHSASTAQSVLLNETPSLRFPLPAGGTTPARFPSRSGGNLKEGGKIGRWHPTLTRGEYARALCAIHEAIAAGEVYQVNYTFRLRAPFSGDLLPLFWQLYERQPVPYAAYIDTGAHAIASLSPELFFALDGERIATRPMKGTAPRGLTLADDLQHAERLTRCPKNRAENLMIVDMARNDLGRIARIGSVRVPRLFEAERYATLWQMTSTVVARTDAPLPEIFHALFPAASITGAPKIRATHVIHALERAPRGVYTGAIGVVLPDRHAQFNVAIRTLHYDKVAAQLTFGVGSGIVWDSEQVAEYEECLTKAQVLFAPRPEFELLETLLWRRGRGYFLLEAHLQAAARLRRLLRLRGGCRRRALPVADRCRAVHRAALSRAPAGESVRRGAGRVRPAVARTQGVARRAGARACRPARGVPVSQDDPSAGVRAGARGTTRLRRCDPVEHARRDHRIDAGECRRASGRTLLHPAR
jgi:para-aminobenzoate synthetase/4-amino-4-deoxychorismate lyase